MSDLVWLIPVLPLAGFLTLALLGGRMKAGAAAAVGCGSVALSMAAGLMLVAGFVQAPPGGLS
jgi:NADH-quinone oxidoreductase subunit L